jgi:membrane protein required for colicin V production
MQTVDICILVLLALPAIIGVLYGFLNIVFSIIAWTLASIIAIKFGAYFTPMLASLTDTVLLQKILAFIGVFIISLMILSGIAFFIMKLLGRTGLTGADRILGLFFGFGLGGFIVAVIVFLGGFTALPKEPWWRESILIEPFQLIADWGHQFLPEDFANHHGYFSEDNVVQIEEAT